MQNLAASCISSQIGMDRGIRLIEIICEPHGQNHKNSRGEPEQGEVHCVATDIMAVDAEVIASIYKHRWVVETVFQFFPDYRDSRLPTRTWQPCFGYPIAIR